VTLTTLGYAVLGGLLPSIFWLYFLLKEDARCPEPKKLIALAFIAGMLAVPLALPLEHFTRASLASVNTVLLAWATIEELLKYVMAAVFILWRRAIDESPDYVIYMITVALGFAAAENMLFLLTPISEGNLMGTLFTGNLRFLGATLLHVTASAMIGFTLGFAASFHYKKRILAASLGLILAITLHTLFNVLIIKEGASTALTAFFLVWTIVVIFLAAFEVLKYFQYRNRPPNTC
jgi:protease PrsW